VTFLFASLHGYRREWRRGDLIAGLTVWAVLVPEALAYASIAGVSPVVGLYAAPDALLLYAAFGSSSCRRRIPVLDPSPRSGGRPGRGRWRGEPLGRTLEAGLAVDREPVDDPQAQPEDRQ
jgi:sulfate permease, SulP family